MMLREKIIKSCDRITEFSLYIAAFYIPVSIALIESFVGLAIAAWLVKKIVMRSSLAKLFYPNILGLPILIYFLICLISSVFSSNRAISFSHLIFKTTEYLLLFFIVVEIANRKFIRNIIIVLIISVGLVGIDGIYQYFTNYDFFRGRTPVISGRINGPFTAPTDFANYIVSLFPLVVSLSFLRFKKRWVNPALIIISLVLFACLVLSASRSAWVALLLAVPIARFLGIKRLFLSILLLIILALIFLPFFSGLAKTRVKEFLHYEKSTFALDRPLLLNTGLNMFVDRPILGQGLGTFMYNFNKFKAKSIEDYPDNWGISYAHNCFLQIAAETGLLGLFSFLFIIEVLFYHSFKLLNKITATNGYFILSGLMTGIFTYLVSSFFDTNLYSLPLAVLFWLIMGLSVAEIKVIKQELA